MDGLEDLRDFIETNDIRSIAIPPLGSGNGRLDWQIVRTKISDALGPLENVDVIVYEPTKKYQNVTKREGVDKLTPARALVAELVRRYSIIGFECTILEVQKLAYFLERVINQVALENPLDLQFSAEKYGPYSDKLRHLLNALDGSYLHCDKRLPDAGPYDVIRFDDSKRDKVAAFLKTPEAKIYGDALETTSEVIEGFESPLGMELLATVYWLIDQRRVEPTVAGIKSGLESWPGGNNVVERKQRLLDDRLIGLALECLVSQHSSILSSS